MVPSPTPYGLPFLDIGVCSLAAPSYLRSRWSCGLQIWRVHLQGQFEWRPIENFGENGAWAYPEIAQIFWVPPIVSGTGRATDYKFGGWIYRVSLSRGLLRIFEKREWGCIQGLSKFWGYPLLSEERIELRTSGFVGAFRGRSEQGPVKNVGNSGRGRSRGVLKIFRTPMYRAHCAVIFAIAQLSCFHTAWYFV